jgi:hypothetical protein
VALAILSLSVAAAPGAESVVPWDSAASHVGRRITVEGVVVQARRVGSATVLEFAAADAPGAFTVKLFQPMFRREPTNPETYYRGKRIQASGVVMQFQGRTEMIIRNAKQIVVLTDAPPQADAPEGYAVDAPSETAPPGPAAATAAGSAAVSATPAGTTSVARSTPTVPPTNPPVIERLGAAERARCATARTEWRALHPKMQQALGAMQKCLQEERAQCGAEIDALDAALADFDAAQAKLDQACEGQ